MQIGNLEIIGILRPGDTVQVVAPITARTVICFRRVGEHEIVMDKAGPGDAGPFFRLRKTETSGELLLEPFSEDGPAAGEEASLPADLREITRQLTFAYRDTDLPAGLAARYTLGRILTVRGILDASIFPGRPYRHMRFLIVSSRFRDIGALGLSRRNFPHLVLPPGSCLMVFDQLGQPPAPCQIALLDLPPHLHQWMQAHPDHPVLKRFHLDLRAAVREDFASRQTEPFPAEVANDADWNARVAGPVGLPDQG